MRTAKPAHQSPDGLALGRLDEVALLQSRPLAEMADVSLFHFGLSVWEMRSVSVNFRSILEFAMHNQ